MEVADRKPLSSAEFPKVGTFCIGALVVVFLLGLVGYILLVIASRASAKRDRETLEKGRPVVGTLVMANTQLFKPDGIDDAPGVIVLTLDPPTPELVAHMRSIGERCFELYKAEKVEILPPVLRAVAERMKDDRYREDRRTLLPAELAGPHTLYLTDLWIHRARLTPWFNNDRVLQCIATGAAEGAIVHMPADDPRGASLWGAMNGAPNFVSPATPSPFSPAYPVPVVHPAPVAPASGAFGPQLVVPPGPAPYPPGNSTFGQAAYPPRTAPPQGMSNETKKMLWILGTVAGVVVVGVFLTSFAVTYAVRNSRNDRRRVRESAAEVARRTDELARASAERKRAEESLEQARIAREKEIARIEAQRQEWERSKRQREAELRARDEKTAELAREAMRKQEEENRKKAEMAARSASDSSTNRPGESGNAAAQSLISGTEVDARDMSRPFLLDLDRRSKLLAGPPGSNRLFVNDDLWDTAQGVKLRTLELGPRDFAGYVLSSDGKWIAKVADRKMQKPKVSAVSVHSLETGETTFETDVEVFAPTVIMQIVRNRVLVISAIRLPDSPVFDLQTGERKNAIKKDARLPVAVPWFSPDGTRYVQTHLDGVSIFATKTGVEEVKLDAPSNDSTDPRDGPFPPPSYPRMPKELFVSLASEFRFSPDGGEIVTAIRHPMPRLVVWNIAGKVVFDRQYPELNEVSKIDLTPIWLPDGRGWAWRGTVIDRKSGRLVFAVDSNSSQLAKMILLDHQRVLAAPAGKSKKLEAYVIPWQKIDEALMQPDGGGLPFVVR